MSDKGDDLPELGSLGQSARSKQLKTARVTLIVVGVLTILANLFMVVSAERVVEEAVQKELRDIPPAQIDRLKLSELKSKAVNNLQLISGAFLAVGFVFIALGLLVNHAPVATTATGLILYLGGWATSAVLDPSMLVQGLLLKIFIIAAMVRALKAAIEYQKEQAAAEVA